MTVVEQTDERAVKEMVATELERARARSTGLTTAVLDGAELIAQHSPLMSPLIWDLAHVGNYEELWLLRAAAGIQPMRPEIDDIYDAFEHPRSERPTLPLLGPAEAERYIAEVRGKVLDSLDAVRLDPRDPLLRGGFVYRMVLQHEHQHDETMLATHQLRGAPGVLVDAPPPDAPADAVTLPAEVLIAGGEFTMGTSSDPWAYDNERPAHRVHVPPFWIDTTPVSNAAYAAFVEAGGYDDARLWSPAGRRWRLESGRATPAFWHRDAAGWWRRRFGRREPLPPDQPVTHVCWHEAQAYCRWAGRRLPTEPEWEKAAAWDPATGRSRRYPWGEAPPDATRANLGQRHHQPAPVGCYPDGASASGVRQLIGDVWEWTSTAFGGYPGFEAFPYPEYSQVFFGGEYVVLRGGSWASDPLAARCTFRNWDYPVRRQIFTGFRTARDAAGVA